MAESIHEILTGSTDSHLVTYRGPYRVNKETLSSLEAIVAAASAEGFEFYLCSSFRSFQDQLRIWNEKARGIRPMVDGAGNKVDVAKLSNKEKLKAILRWSALPGASRHHWGTDLDVYDKKALPPGYVLKLVPSEFEGNGFSAPLHDWLDDNLERFGFFRPYQTNRGGVSPERWHLSFAPVSQKYLGLFKIEILEAVIQNTEIELKKEILESLDSIYQSYVLNIDLP